MKIVSKLTLVASILLLSLAAVYAQGFLRADHKINGGRVRSNQRHAQDEALELYHLSQIQRPIPKGELSEFLATIRKDLAASDQALAKLETESRKVKDASELVDSIKKHHVKAVEQCGMAEKSLTKADGGNVVVGACCSEIYYELEGALADTQKLLAALKIENLDPPKKTATK